MQLDTMPTLAEKPNPDAFVATEAGAQLSTQHGGREPFGERFRRSKLREQMFGDAGDQLRIGRYRVIDKIGAGAMGVVYLAVDDELERQVAIKLLKADEEVGRERMLREAKALAKLSHPNVVTVHEVGTHEGHVYVAMEFVDGRTLREWLDAKPPVPAILDVFSQAAKGLQAAHDASIVHRDFKPDNVLVGKDGRVRVLDFGLARPPGASLAGEVADANEVTDLAKPTLTRTGMFAGTPAYMAPEQFAGSPVDARTDQFAFCVALHEALHGERPFQGETLAELASKVIEGEAMTSTTRGISPNVDAVIRRGIAGDPQRRFPSMNALVLALRYQGVPAPSWVKWALIGVFGFLGFFFLTGIAAYLVFAQAEPEPHVPKVAPVAVAEPPEPPVVKTEEQIRNALKATEPLAASPDLVNPFASDADRKAVVTQSVKMSADAAAAAYAKGDFEKARTLYGKALTRAGILEWSVRWPLFHNLAQAADRQYEQTSSGADLKRAAAIYLQMVAELESHPMVPDAEAEEHKRRSAELIERAGRVNPVSSPDPDFVRLTVHAHVTVPVEDPDGTVIGTTNAPLVLPAGESTLLRIPLAGYGDSVVAFDGAKDHDSYAAFTRRDD